MPTGITTVIDGIEWDFEDLFDPDIVGDGPSVPWLENDGVPLKFAAIAYGTKGPDVGFDDADVDVSNLWAARGTAVYSITGLQGKSLHAGDNALTNQPTVSASVWVSIHSDGTWSVGGSSSKGGVGQAAPTSGTWLPAGASVGDYQVQFVAALTGDGLIANGAPVYAAVTTTRGLSLGLPNVEANNANEREGTASVLIHLKRVSTGHVTTTGLAMHVSTVGYA